jgi:hypothetical protein
MKYLSGETVVVGDKVDLGGGMTGVVLYSFEDGQVAAGYSAEEWSGLKQGVMVKSDKAGFIHFPEPNVDLVFLSRD